MKQRAVPPASNSQVRPLRISNKCYCIDCSSVTKYFQNGVPLFTDKLNVPLTHFEILDEGSSWEMLETLVEHSS
jgi:hypothetical protein